jgi:hypothetical protein
VDSCSYAFEGPLPVESWSSVPLPPTSTFSTAATSVVPIIADRVALPESLNIVPFCSILPPKIAEIYLQPESPSLMRHPLEVYLLNQTKPLRAPRVAGSRVEYVKLIGRMLAQGMITFTSTPRAVNGVFTVGKDADSDRLIIDAQPANRLFVDSPHVSLPNPSHLVQLQVPSGSEMFVAKSDLSNYYHHLGMPSWFWDYFALPPLSVEELASIGITDPNAARFPACITVPMGFSHAVYIGQTGHENILYSSGAIDPEDNIMHLTSPIISHDRAPHGMIVDDWFLLCLNRLLAQRIFDKVIAAYRAAGFVVKDSKVVHPTSKPIKVIGFEICGATSVISLSTESRVSLVRSTLSALRSGQLTGTGLSHLIGRWTWCMLIRRPSLSVLQHVYRFMLVARGRRFDMWPSVRRELWMLLGLIPLLQARFDAPFFHRVIASDASETAGGVVSTLLTDSLHRSYWPLCSNRRHAILQATLNNDLTRQAITSGIDLSDSHVDDHALSCLRDRLSSFDDFYSDVMSAPWSVIISSPWRNPEHINALELRAVLLAVHWALTFPSSTSRRVYMLVDSTVAFFSLWKGRSSSISLLLILRKISALLLASSMTLLPGWIPSAVNPADAPSRLKESTTDSLSHEP